MKRAKHIKMTEKEFKRQKRKQFRDAEKVLNNLRGGCAYLPDEASWHLRIAIELFDKAHEMCRYWWKNA